jgi:hypothetical protein
VFWHIALLIRKQLDRSLDQPNLFEQNQLMRNLVAITLGLQGHKQQALVSYG